jgi:hypothetical protein
MKLGSICWSLGHRDSEILQESIGCFPTGVGKVPLLGLDWAPSQPIVLHGSALSLAPSSFSITLLGHPEENTGQYESSSLTYF